MNSKDFIGKGSAYIADTLAKSKGTPLSPEFYVLQEYLKAELNRELIESQKEYQDESFNRCISKCSDFCDYKKFWTRHDE